MVWAKVGIEAKQSKLQMLSAISDLRIIKSLLSLLRRIEKAASPARRRRKIVQQYSSYRIVLMKIF
jgi:hypothetical protein